MLDGAGTRRTPKHFRPPGWKVLPGGTPEEIAARQGVWDRMAAMTRREACNDAALTRVGGAKL